MSILKMAYAFEADYVVDEFEDPKLKQLNGESARSYFAHGMTRGQRSTTEAKERGKNMLSGSFTGSLLGSAGGALAGGGALLGTGRVGQLIGSGVGAGVGGLAGSVLGSRIQSKKEIPINDFDRRLLESRRQSEDKSLQNLLDYMEENDIEWPSYE